MKDVSDRFIKKEEKNGVERELECALQINFQQKKGGRREKKSRKFFEKKIVVIEKG